MKLTDQNSKTLMLSIHQKIEEYANDISEHLNNGEIEDLLSYPPNCGFSDKEIHSLNKITNDPDLKSALRKILADNSAGIVFELMNLIDGTSDPDENLVEWPEVALIDKSDKIKENDEMLHDSLYSTYWDWKEIRPENSWKLDNLDE
jgi:hypothetical protein